MRASLQPNEFLIVRFRDRTGYPVTWTSPFFEATKLGLYHEGLIAVTNHDFFATEVLRERDTGTPYVGTTMRLGMYGGGHVDLTEGFAALLGGDMESKNFSFRAVGIAQGMTSRDFFANALQFPMRGGGAAAYGAEYDEAALTGSYSLLRRNCHHHVAAVLKQLRMRR